MPQRRKKFPPWWRRRLVLCGLAALAVAASAAPGSGVAMGRDLAHGRGLEIVSPPERRAGDVVPMSYRFRASGNGGTVVFASLTGFGDVAGMGVSADYLSQRTGTPGTNGWATHGLTPEQAYMTLGGHLFGGEPKYSEFSDDLSIGVLQAWSPLTDDPMTREVINLYRRSDMLDPGIGSFELLTACPLCVGPISILDRAKGPAIAGASSDLTHVIFESALNLAAGASGTTTKLYEWAGGQVRLAGVLPNGSGAPRSAAGRGVAVGVGGRTTSHPISDDGSHIFFTVGTRNNSVEGDLYLRIEGRTTVKLNMSERAVADAPRAATYADASADGSRAFFITREALTDDVALGGDPKLYMWARASTNETQTVAVSASAGSFVLGHAGVSTQPISFDASSAAVEAELASLPSIGRGNVEVTGGPGDATGSQPYEIEFHGDFAGVNVPQLTADGGGLSGVAATASVVTPEPVENLTFLNRDEEPSDISNTAEGVVGVGDDGRSVYFVATGQLVAGAPTLGTSAGLYLWRDGATEFIGRLSAFGGDKDVLFDGPAQSLAQKQTQVTPDGRHLLFTSGSGDGLLSVHGMADYDHGDCGGGEGCRQLYVYSADTRTLQCASCNPMARAATARAITRVLPPSIGGAQIATYLSRPFSDDGRFVFFSTREALVAEDINDQIDAYEFNVARGSVHLLTSGKSTADSYFLDASSSGNDAFVVTRERLVGWDDNDYYDVYDARVGGGLPEPLDPAPGCVGDACQGAPTGDLGERAIGSAITRGAGDFAGKLQPRVSKCRRGQGRKRVVGKLRCARRRNKGRCTRGRAASSRAGAVHKAKRARQRMCATRRGADRGLQTGRRDTAASKGKDK